MSVNAANTIISVNGEATAFAVAHWLTDLAVSTTGPFSVCLSGGGTPRALYRMLAEPPFVGKFPWLRTHWFWGDERFVPADHPDSNYRMAKEAMLDRVPAASENIHPMRTDLADAAASSDAYEAELNTFLHEVRRSAGKGTIFDVVLLGLGDDGHTASLFPGTATLHQSGRLVDSIVGARPEPRITLTYPAIASSEHVAFLVCGAAKKDIVNAIWGGADLPAAKVTSHGEVLWFFDTAAAQDIVADNLQHAVGA